MLLLAPKQDVVIVLTTPPLLSVVATFFIKLRGGKLVIWNMDLNPDEAIAAGWIKSNSLTARSLEGALRYSLRASYGIVVLDRFMKDRIVAKDIPKEKVHIIPVWSHDHAISYDPKGRESFRRQLGVAEKFVVMYSGNHSPLHPLDTLMEAARRLNSNPTIAFAFVGGGSEFQRVKTYVQNHDLSNTVFAPYQPLDHLAGSLSAADLQVVLLGDPFVGIVHPCKIYNMLAVGAPFLYIGPTESHITDLKQFPEIGRMGCFVRHGDADQVVAFITKIASEHSRGLSSRPGRPPALEQFSQYSLIPVMIQLIESTACGQ